MANKKELDKGKVIIHVMIYLGIAVMGMVIGMTFQQAIFQSTLMKVAGNMDGVTVNIEFNETLMMETAMKEMEDIVWDMRMENCTRTEKNYCALQCYENKKLIPCENFTMDEHFCSEGICEVDGVCPEYFEILEGKTLKDCIKEVENDAKEKENVE